MSEIQCKTCDAGILRPKKIYRMSGVVVTIGYILLIPSILGIFFSFFLLVGIGFAAKGADSALQKEASKKLRKAHIDESILHKLLFSKQLSRTEQEKLSPRQTEIAREVQTSLATGKAGTGIGTFFAGGLAVFLGVSSFVGGLLGWLLVMKKKVLQCNKCKTVITTS